MRRRRREEKRGQKEAKRDVEKRDVPKSLPRMICRGENGQQMGTMDQVHAIRCKHSLAAARTRRYWLVVDGSMMRVLG